MINLDNLYKAVYARAMMDGGKILTPAEREKRIAAGGTVYHLKGVKNADGSLSYVRGNVMQPNAYSFTTRPKVVTSFPALQDNSSYPNKGVDEFAKSVKSLNVNDAIKIGVLLFAAKLILGIFGRR
jgi:hypothetical protein